MELSCTTGPEMQALGHWTQSRAWALICSIDRTRVHRSREFDVGSVTVAKTQIPEAIPCFAWTWCTLGLRTA
jgi:hypothetical protein